MRLSESIASVWQWWRKLLFRAASTNTRMSGLAIENQPVQYMGQGQIVFGQHVQLGFSPSPFFYDGSVYLESREYDATIHFGNNIMANNNLKVICERTRVEIGDNVLIGTNVEIIDSDFHAIDPAMRNSGRHQCAPVIIGRNVFIGSNVRILKGVTIGENSVIGNSSVVSADVPANVIAAGFPAKVIRPL